jgi:hypothetical protein
MKVRRLKKRFYARTYMSTVGKLRAEWWGYRQGRRTKWRALG